MVSRSSSLSFFSLKACLISKYKILLILIYFIVKEWPRTNDCGHIFLKCNDNGPLFIKLKILSLFNKLKSTFLCDSFIITYKNILQEMWQFLCNCYSNINKTSCNCGRVRGRSYIANTTSSYNTAAYVVPISQRVEYISAIPHCNLKWYELILRLKRRATLTMCPWPRCTCCLILTCATMTNDKIWVCILIINDCGTENFLNVFIPVIHIDASVNIPVYTMTSYTAECL